MRPRTAHTHLLAALLLISALAMPWSAAAAAPTADDAPQAASALHRLDDALQRLSGDHIDAAPTPDAVARRIYRRYYQPAPQHVVVVQRPTTTVVTHHRSDPPIYARPPQRAGIAVGLRFAALSLGDTSLKYETFEGANLIGVGGYLRGMFDPHFGLEVAVDILGANEPSYSQFAVPVMAGFVVRLLPDSLINAYGVMGGGVIFNNIEYYDGTNRRAGVDESFIQLAGQLGAGVEVNLGHLQLTADLRWLFLQARPERDARIRATAPLEDTTTTANTRGLTSVTHALQFNLGVGGSF
jgi:hypothetical protein